MDAVDLHHQQIERGQVPRQPAASGAVPRTQAAIRSADSATKRRDAADFDTPAPGPAGTSPSGRRTARPKRRVVTPSSIRFSAQRPSQSSATARSQLGSITSSPPRWRTRGRSTATLPP
jgi:hypothetical protein